MKGITNKKRKITLINMSGSGFLGVLALIFITLKLCGTITWSWWWVLAPLWMPPVITIAFLIAVLALVIAVLVVVLTVVGLVVLIIELVDR